VKAPTAVSATSAAAPHDRLDGNGARRMVNPKQIRARKATGARANGALDQRSELNQRRPRWMFVAATLVAVALATAAAARSDPAPRRDTRNLQPPKSFSL
jgi:hypothetical protein